MRRRPWTSAVLLTSLATCLAASACSSSGSGRAATSPPPVTPSSSHVTPPAPSSSAVAARPTPTVTRTKHRHRPVAVTSSAAPTRQTSSTAAASGGQALPLNLRTHGAKQVITVVAPSSGSTTGTLQAWHSTSGGWRKVGPSMTAELGSNGVGPTSESESRTPAGSFTLTQAFGHDPNPGTGLPYLQTTPADWWISTPGPQYNTHQRCSSCGYGDPDEHLYYETPYYNYAVVIDYNTPNAPGGVRQGAGSAFFLHVTVGQPTAGCVAIPQDQLVRIMRWLDPAQHPRILIGVG